MFSPDINSMVRAQAPTLPHVAPATQSQTKSIDVSSLECHTLPVIERRHVDIEAARDALPPELVTALKDASHCIRPDNSFSFGITILIKFDSDNHPQILVFFGESHVVNGEEKKAAEDVLKHSPRRAHENFQASRLLLGDYYFHQTIRKPRNDYAEKMGDLYPGPICMASVEWGDRQERIIRALNNVRERLEGFHDDLASGKVPPGTVCRVKLDTAEETLDRWDKRLILELFCSRGILQIDKSASLDPLPAMFDLESDHRPTIGGHLVSVSRAIEHMAMNAIFNDRALNDLFKYSCVISPAAFLMERLVPTLGASDLGILTGIFAVAYATSRIGAAFFREFDIGTITTEPILNWLSHRERESRDNTMTAGLVKLEEAGEIRTPLLVQTGELHREPIVRALKNEQGWQEVELNQL